MDSGVCTELQKFSERVQKNSSNSTKVHQEWIEDPEQKENKFLEPHKRVLKTPQKQSTSHLVLGEIQPDVGPLRTPTKVKETAGDPWTPTANLKMLISAASPEIRSREQKKGQFMSEIEFIETSDYSQEQLSGDDYEKIQPSRKEKSLGLLCYKFLARYHDYPNPAVNNDICLDEVAGDLNVERRRIYDIVNVLESLHMVRRLAKNRYTWHGRHNLNKTLGILKKVGEEHRYAEQMQEIKKREFEREFEDEVKEPTWKQSTDTQTEVHKEMCFIELPGMEFRAASVNSRKDKSLRLMSQKFVMLFLVSKPHVVSLEVAAKILIGEDQVVDLDKSKFKTKIRRLYDIANVLSSLELIKKVHVTEEKGRKPAFKWIGPEVFTNINDVNPVKTTTSAVLNTSISKPLAEQCNKNLFPASSPKQSFTRHPSLIKLAKSIEDDRRKINSAPTSPIKKSTCDSCNCETFPSRMAQLAAICKLQLEQQQSKQNKKKSKPQLTKPKALPVGLCEPVLNSELHSPSSTQASGSSLQAVGVLPVVQGDYSPVIPIMLPHSHTGGSYALFLHPSANPFTKHPSGSTIQSMTLCTDTGTEGSINNVEEGRLQVNSPKKDISLSCCTRVGGNGNSKTERDGVSTPNEITPEKYHKRVCIQESEDISLKKFKSDSEKIALSRGASPNEAELQEIYQARQKARRGLTANRPSPRALHLDPEFINAPEGKDGNSSEGLSQSVECFLENEEKLGQENEARAATVQALPVAFAIPAQLQAETMIPSGYLIPLTPKSTSPDKEKEGCFSQQQIYHSPVTGSIPGTSGFTPLKLPIPMMTVPVSSVASFPVVSQASSHAVPLQSPSPAILNFTLQNLGLISTGVHLSPSPGHSTTASMNHLSPIPAQFGLQQGKMFFVKSISPVPVHNQLTGQPVTLLSLQQPVVPVTPEGHQLMNKESFFRTPGGVTSDSPLASLTNATSNSATKILQKNVHVPQRKLEVCTEDM
nr:PREDICTED: transcription factor E2F8 isoform X1 [Latimeria chalumnae]|eukprot:XP_014343982.1 PREDICTED: transcription factor E2F8 isoform X1 [Latimeria chalumnae]